MVIALATAEETKPAPPKEQTATQEEGTPLEQALKKLELPGIKININEKCVDVTSSVCLDSGALELIACTKDTKEHEAIVMVEALPKHIHTALLLVGAVPGNPAMFKQVGTENDQSWVQIPPRGGLVDVSLVITDKEGKTTERPISDFISPLEDSYGEVVGNKKEGEKERFPTSTFLFAGSILDGDGTGPRKYVCDLSGNVISIATFGDEVLCLPDIHASENGQLMWQINAENLPEVGSKVILRLRPQFAKEPPKPAKESATSKP
jgi:hypothetical protein